ncbi:septin-1 isoform X3 [Carettochelys insculpta]|uniref:septin-1 isoform X3 n=1 Tax=Carettochelys insculpta TaxID=44489 RepID=UPI003EC0769A
MGELRAPQPWTPPRAESSCGKCRVGGAGPVPHLAPPPQLQPVPSSIPPPSHSCPQGLLDGWASGLERGLGWEEAGGQGRWAPGRVWGCWANPLSGCPWGDPAQPPKARLPGTAGGERELWGRSVGAAPGPGLGQESNKRRAEERARGVSVCLAVCLAGRHPGEDAPAPCGSTPGPGRPAGVGGAGSWARHRFRPRPAVRGSGQSRGARCSRSREQTCSTMDKEYVGFATLPNQLHRKSVKKGFDFTLMVAGKEFGPNPPPPSTLFSPGARREPRSLGSLPRSRTTCPPAAGQRTQESGLTSPPHPAGESGLGKSTLIDSLFLTDLYKDRTLLDAQARIPRTLAMERRAAELEEGGVRVKLTVVDTPGFGDAVDNADCWVPIVDYIDQQFEQFFRDESGLNRKNITDGRVHCCLYFLSPFGHGLRPLDVAFLQAVQHKVNIVPVIGRADALTPREVDALKEKIREQLEENAISIYQFPDCDSDEDEAFKAQDAELKHPIRRRRLQQHRPGNRREGLPGAGVPLGGRGSGEPGALRLPQAAHDAGSDPHAGPEGGDPGDPLRELPGTVHPEPDPRGRPRPRQPHEAVPAKRHGAAAAAAGGDGEADPGEG